MDNVGMDVGDSGSADLLRFLTQNQSPEVQKNLTHPVGSSSVGLVDKTLRLE